MYIICKKFQATTVATGHKDAALPQYLLSETWDVSPESEEYTQAYHHDG
jgi:hypothetical protein